MRHGDRRPAIVDAAPVRLGMQSSMKLSVIIPAYNEEKLLPDCLAHVFAALRANAAPDWTAEVIVTDNNSTDRTGQIARDAGARVVFEPVNQISRARNAGARVATGDWFLFVDADSTLHPATVADLLHCIRRGRSAGGGCLVDLDVTPPGARALLVFWDFLSVANRWAAGSFVFCRADAFRDLGGFSTKLYAAEEIAFSEALKRWADRRGLKVAILRRQRHVSSGRKFHLYSRGEILSHGLRGLLLPRTLRDRSRLDYFYDGRR
jgi:glycosyltransferase involved in cell wall biosynthesis